MILISDPRRHHSFDTPVFLGGKAAAKDGASTKPAMVGSSFTTRHHRSSMVGSAKPLPHVKFCQQELNQEAIVGQNLWSPSAAAHTQHRHSALARGPRRERRPRRRACHNGKSRSPLCPRASGSSMRASGSNTGVPLIAAAGLG